MGVIQSMWGPEEYRLEKRLLAAAESGDGRLARTCIEEGADVNYVDREGKSNWMKFNRDFSS